MTDTERLDLIERYKLEIRFADYSNEWVIGTYESNGGFFHWARNADLRTALDEAKQELKGLNNATAHF